MLLLDGEISRTDGALLLAAFVAYIYIIIHAHKHEQIQNPKGSAQNFFKEIILTLAMWLVLFLSGHIPQSNLIFRW